MQDMESIKLWILSLALIEYLLIINFYIIEVIDSYFDKYLISIGNCNRYEISL